MASVEQKTDNSVAAAPEKKTGAVLPDPNPTNLDPNLASWDKQKLIRTRGAKYAKAATGAVKK